MLQNLMLVLFGRRLYGANPDAVAAGRIVISVLRTVIARRVSGAWFQVQGSRACSSGLLALRAKFIACACECVVTAESVSPSSKPRAAPGRPRQSGLDAQIVAAVVRLLARHSYVDISMELIAQEAGVGKATVYRRWPHKAALIVDVLLEQALTMQIPFENVSYRDHLAAGMRGLRDMLTSHFSKAIMAIISETQHNEALRQRFYEGFVSRMQAIGEADLEVAIVRGEVRADVDKELVFDQVFGMFYYRLLMVQKPLDDNTIDHIVDNVMKQLS